MVISVQWHSNFPEWAEYKQTELKSNVFVIHRELTHGSYILIFLASLHYKKHITTKGVWGELQFHPDMLKTNIFRKSFGFICCWNFNKVGETEFLFYNFPVCSQPVLSSWTQNVHCRCRWYLQVLSFKDWWCALTLDNTEQSLNVSFIAKGTCFPI